MATIKSYTDLKQSKKLIELGIDVDTADMCYINEKPNIGFLSEEYKMFGDNILTDYYPAWSLAALFNVIPQEILDGEYILNITEGREDIWVLTYNHYENKNHSYYGLSVGADNLVDACYKMIIRLHELNLL